MWENLFFWTRFCFLNLDSTWGRLLAPFLLMLFLRVFLLPHRPCKGLLLGMPAAYLVVSVVNAALFTVSDLSLIDVMYKLSRLEPVLLLGWLGALAGTVIVKLRRKAPESGAEGGA